MRSPILQVPVPCSDVCSVSQGLCSHLSACPRTYPVRCPCPSTASLVGHIWDGLWCKSSLGTRWAVCQSSHSLCAARGPQDFKKSRAGYSPCNLLLHPVRTESRMAQKEVTCPRQCRRSHQWELQNRITGLLTSRPGTSMLHNKGHTVYLVQ